MIRRRLLNSLPSATVAAAAVATTTTIITTATAMVVPSSFTNDRAGQRMLWAQCWKKVGWKSDFEFTEIVGAIEEK